MKIFNRALCTTLALSIALPWNVFASSGSPVIDDSEKLSEVEFQQIQNPDELLAKLPAEVKFVEKLKETDAEFNAPLYSDIKDLAPIGRPIENRKTGSTLQFICLQQVTKTADCTLFQIRKDGQKLFGPKYAIRTLAKEAFIAQLKQKEDEDKMNHRADYVDYNSLHLDSNRYESDFADWYFEGGIGFFIAGGVAAWIATGFAVNASLAATADMVGVGVGLAVGLGVAFAPYVIGTVIIAGAGVLIFGHNRISDIRMAFRKHKMDKSFKAMMDGESDLTKVYRTSNKNFKHIEEAFK